MRLCWVKSWKIFDWGWDPDIKLGFNKRGMWVSLIRGYFVGVFPRG